MRAAIYARYSSDNQSDASIEDQVRLCRARIEREGWTYLQAYTDRAVSGSTSLRAAYQALLEDARSGKFDILVAEALDRLSRDQEDVAALFKRMRFAGIGIVTLAEGEISELHVGLKGTMNALFLKDLAQKTHRGLEGRVRQGRSGGGNSFGYDVVRERDAAGDAIRGGRRINQAQAEIVRRIFREFAAGRSPRAVARTLNEDRIPGPGGRPWSDTTIRGHHDRRTGILRNELYIGRLVWNRQRYIKDPSTGKRLARPNPEDKWITTEVPELRILDQSLWNEAQERLKAIHDSPGVQKARSTEFWKKRRPHHILTNLVYCAECGGAYSAVGRDYLACGAARRQGTCSNHKGISRSALEHMVLDALKHNLMQPELVAEFIGEYSQETNRLRAERELQRETEKRELLDVTRKLDGLIEAISEGLRGARVSQQLQELESRRERLLSDLERPYEPMPRLHPNLSELYARKVAELHTALQVQDTRDEALGLIRSLIERIVVGAKDDGIEVELVGEIANMVAIANNALPNNKKAAPDRAAVLDTFRSSVKVVAGAGFEPATFRL